MSTATIPDAVPGTHEHDPDENYLVSHGTRLQRIMSWAFTLDHKRIGVMYLVAIMASFGLGGLMAVVIRTELITPDIDVLATPWLMRLLTFGKDPANITPMNLYNQVFTLHGAIMVFLFIIPSIPAALGNFILPLQLGAKDVAFPRLNLGSFWLYTGGAAMTVVAIVHNAVDTGWTFYTPYSTDTHTSVIWMTAGVFVMGFSSILTGLNFIVTIHKMRPHGMTWFKMPLFLWGIYATAIIQVLATPVLGITLALLIMDRYLGVGIFDPLRGGDPVLFQHFFWFYSHPAVYIMILPGMAIISELITCYSRKTIFGYRMIALSSLGIALISFLVWGHHMFVSGESELAVVVFSGLTFLVAIPSAIKVFNWIATLYRGSILLKTPMLYALSFLFLFTIGGLTGLHLATLSTDVHFHDTYFVVAHFHYVMVGGTVIAFLGGLHHWWPKMFGKMYSEFWGAISAALVFVGFNMTFFTQFFLGSRGMPRRYATYQETFQGLHVFSSIGSYVLGLGFLIMLIYLMHSLKWGKIAPSNPWGASTLEWTTTSPPIHHNFHGHPEVGENAPYDYGVPVNEATVKR